MGMGSRGQEREQQLVKHRRKALEQYLHLLQRAIMTYFYDDTDTGTDSIVPVSVSAQSQTAASPPPEMPSLATPPVIQEADDDSDDGSLTTNIESNSNCSGKEQSNSTNNRFTTTSTSGTNTAMSESHLPQTQIPRRGRVDPGQFLAMRLCHLLFDFLQIPGHLARHHTSAT
jgi:hypothetical protein